VQRAARQEGIAQAEAQRFPHLIEHLTQKLKQLWQYYILPKLYDFGFFDLFWIFLAPASRVATPPDGIPPCSSPTRIRARAQQPVILLIHRQESISLLEFYIALSPEDSEQVHERFASPHRMSSQLTLHTPGFGLGTEQIARALIRHPAKLPSLYHVPGGGNHWHWHLTKLMDANAVIGQLIPVVTSLRKYPQSC